MAERELCVDELVQRILELRFAEAGNCGQKRMAELPADAGRHLRDLLDGGEPVQAGHQRILQRGRDRQLRQRAGKREAMCRLPQPSRLDDGLRQFLDEERHRSEENTSELQSLMRIAYAVFCLKKKKN